MSLINLLELPGRVSRRVSVRVHLHGLSTKGRFDFTSVCVEINAKGRVVPFGIPVLAHFVVLFSVTPGNGT
ncbi:hypothetical protein D3C87_1578630 [compost metagenome]